MVDLTDRVLAYLSHHQVMTLATVGDNGVWAAAVFYVNHRFDLYFLSAGHTRHGLNMQAQPQVAATIQEDYRDWQAIKGIQLEGRVEVLTGEMKDTAVALYSRKYPFIAQAEPQIQKGLARVNWYHLKPERLYFIDNSLGMGHRDEVELPGYISA